jgi:hypothetical protein
MSMPLVPIYPIQLGSLEDAYKSKGNTLWQTSDGAVLGFEAAERHQRWLNDVSSADQPNDKLKWFQELREYLAYQRDTNTDLLVQENAGRILSLFERPGMIPPDFRPPSDQ